VFLRQGLATYPMLTSNSPQLPRCWDHRHEPQAPGPVSLKQGECIPEMPPHFQIIDDQREKTGLRVSSSVISRMGN
jgi:hypothetical protein